MYFGNKKKLYPKKLSFAVLPVLEITTLNDLRLSDSLQLSLQLRCIVSKRSEHVGFENRMTIQLSICRMLHGKIF